MFDLKKLNSVIQERDEMILMMKLEICDLRSQITQKSNTSNDQVTNLFSNTIARK